MTKDELEKEAIEYAETILKSFYNSDKNIMKLIVQAYLDCAEPREKQITELSKHVVELQIDKDESIDRYKKLKAQIEKKMKCLNEKIIKTLKECQECEWLPAYNGKKAKYIYLQYVIDIINEKFEMEKE